MKANFPTLKHKEGNICCEGCYRIGKKEQRKEDVENEIKFLKEQIENSNKGIKEKCDCNFCVLIANKLVNRIKELKQKLGEMK